MLPSFFAIWNKSILISQTSKTKAMEIRKATTTDIDAIALLYRDTINTVNAKDYSKEQIQAWASTYINQHAWAKRIEEQQFYAAIIKDIIVGFASIDNNSYLDLLYVHKDFQRQGIAAALLEVIESAAKEMGFKEITVQSSTTALPFFLSHAFIETYKKEKLVNGVSFVNPFLSKKI